MLIWHAPEYDVSELRSLLAHTTKDEASVSILTDLDAVSKALVKDSDRQLILLCAPAADAVCMAMKRGATPGEALETWIREARSILTLQRKNRRNTTLFDVGMITLFPKQFSTFAGIPHPRVQMALVDMDSLRKTDPVLFLMAYHSLYASPAARELLDEIEACAPDLANGAEMPGLDSNLLFQSYRSDLQKGKTKQDQQKAENKALTRKFELSKKELGDNLVQIEKLQQDYEQKYLHFQIQTETLENELGTIYNKSRKQQDKVITLLNTEQILIGKNAQIQEKLEALTSREIQLKQRLEQLNQGIESIQIQLETKSGDLARKEKELATKLQDLNAIKSDHLAAQQEISRLNDSRSMRITAPLRWLFKMLGRKRTT